MHFLSFHMIRITLIGMVLFLPTSLFAMSVDAQHALYKDAYSALRSGKMSAFESLKNKLEPTGYPLYAYLEFESLKHEITQKTVDQKEINAFLASQQGTILEKRLREFWLSKLAKEQSPANDALFLTEYRDLGDVGLKCTALSVRLRNLDKKALDEIQPIWLTGASLPDECNNTIASWIKAGRLTKALAWSRITLAIEEKEYGLAMHLKKYLPYAEQGYVNTWIMVARDPQLVTSTRLFGEKHSALNNIQVYGISKLARRDVEVGQKAFDKINKPGHFTEAEKQRIYGAIALELATEHSPESAQWYAKLKPEFYTPAMHEWHVRQAIWQGDWKTAAAAVEQMPKELREDSAWQYWYGRALLKLGKTQEATPILAKVSKERLFQGFFASDLIQTPYPLNLPTPQVTEQHIQLLKKNPGIARALEFYRLKQEDASRIEWDYVTKRIPEWGKQTAATIAYNMGWYDRAIFTLSRADNRNNTTIRFPIVYKDVVLNESKRQGLSPAWVFAIARRESAFVTDARSPVGALGLMQLMPLTAKQLSRKLREPFISPSQLLDIRKNVHLGTVYLNQLYGDLNDNLVLATAAYNAGPHRVYQWLPPQNTSIDPDIWIENIPFYETREYVKNVLIYRMIYENRLSPPPARLKTLLKPIQAW
ncbi:MAG: transglycosylase SLT domain-containing protein [Gammaproteobacteria bacterium]